MANAISGITKTVASNATPERISATDLVVQVLGFSAPSANTGDVFIGDSSVSSTAGFCIPKGTTIPVQAISDAFNIGETLNLKDVWAAVGTNGDKVSVLYAKKV